MLGIREKQKAKPIVRDGKILTILNCDVFMCTTYHRDGKLIGKDLDLLDKVSNQFFIIS
jgi:phosphoribosylformimino-5-aminoimidazole carboxamide ribonucleotide (ProFAR) isomerase